MEEQKDTCRQGDTSGGERGGAPKGLRVLLRWLLHDSRPSAVRLSVAALLLVSCPLLRRFFAWRGPALFPAYRSCSRALMGAFATVWSVVPFAVWDIGAAVAIVAALVIFVRRVRARMSLVPWLSWVALAGSLTWALFANGWALNHYAPPLADELGLEVSTYSVDELVEATEHYLNEAARLAPQVPRAQDGSLAPQDFFELARIAGAAYGPLAGSYAIFQGPRVPVKALLVWGEPLLYSGHTGIFWAPTGESGVPLNCADADKPFIMCHEAAHLLGIASEQEANFAAYLACETSSDVRFCYAGAYNAFCYCFNALCRYDLERAEQLLTEAAEGPQGMGVALVWGDRLATRAHYDAYEGTFEKVGTTVNDRYLKSYGETSGVQSYGLVVDYLIAWSKTN